MSEPKVTTIHQRTISGFIDHDELVRLAGKFLLESAGERPGLLTRRGVTLKVRFEDKTEGSPPYRVGTRAFVEITQDMEAQHEVAAP